MPVRKPRVCAYARVSTDAERQLGSFENQVEIYTEKIKGNPDWEFAGIYSDPGISGTIAERPGFQKMLQDAKRHKFDIILVKSISRFARNTILCIEKIRMLQGLGIAVIFEKENIDTSKPYSEMILTILSSFAQEESRNASERLKKGKKMRALNGQSEWRPIYGYTNEAPHSIIEEEADVIRRIFNEYESGADCGEIARGLNRDGLPRRAGEKWAKSTVWSLLKNEKHIGDVLLNKSYNENHITHKKVRNEGRVEQIYLKNHHPGIISRTQFERVAAIREMKREMTYPFGDKLRCPVCGEPLTIFKDEWNNQAQNYYYWYCDGDDFIVSTKVKKAVLAAYNQLTLEGVTDEETIRIKTEHPAFDSVEYWWVDALIEKVTFSPHERMSERTLTVHWKCGKRTTVPSGMNVTSDTWNRIINRRQKNKPARRKKKSQPAQEPKVVIVQVGEE